MPARLRSVDVVKRNGRQRPIQSSNSSHLLKSYRFSSTILDSNKPAVAPVAQSVAQCMFASDMSDPGGHRGSEEERQKKSSSGARNERSLLNHRHELFLHHLNLYFEVKRRVV
jgi:hypothetical protein